MNLSGHPLAHAYRLIESGDKAAARAVLARYLKANPDTAQGWYLLSLVVDDPVQEAQSLERALTLKPDFAEARERLGAITVPDEFPGSAEFEPPKEAPSPEPRFEEEPPEDWPDLPDEWETEVGIAGERTTPPDELADLAARIDAAMETPPTREPELRSPEAPSTGELAELADQFQEYSLQDTEPAQGEPEPELVILPEAAPAVPESVADMLEPLPEEEPPQESVPEPMLPEEQLRHTAVRRLRPPDPRSRRRWIWLIVALVVILALVTVAFGYLLWQGGLFSSPLPTPAPPPVGLLPSATLQAPATLPVQVLPPTWTPTPTLTPSGPPLATPTPPLPPPNPEMAAEMEIIQGQVAALRGLSALERVPRYLIPLDRVRDTLESLILEENSDLKREAADQVRVLSALGLIQPSYDLYTKMLNNQGDSLGGFYVPWTRELYVIGDQFTSLERFIFSHEYGHALVDQHFRLDEVGVYPECELDAQHCEAIRALVEGDASLLMYQWLEQHTSEEEQLDIFLFDPPTEIISSADFPPPYVIREQEFRYGDGLAFVNYLHDRGTWALVDLAYQNLPMSTEQILHPEKYLQGEAPIPVDPQPLEETLGEGWRVVEADVLGELMTYMILGQGVEAITQLDEETATAAAAGWAGDSYQVYYKSSTNEQVLAIHWVWDTQEDADEFYTAMTTYLTRRYAGVQPDDSPGDCWDRQNQQVSCLFSQASETLWLQTPSMGVMEQVLSEYPGFQNQGN